MALEKFWSVISIRTNPLLVLVFGWCFFPSSFSFLTFWPKSVRWCSLIQWIFSVSFLRYQHKIHSRKTWRRKTYCHLLPEIFPKTPSKTYLQRNKVPHQRLFQITSFLVQTPKVDTWDQNNLLTQDQRNYRLILIPKTFEVCSFRKCHGQCQLSCPSVSETSCQFFNKNRTWEVKNLAPPPLFVNRDFKIIRIMNWLWVKTPAPLGEHPA